MEAGLLVPDGVVVGLKPVVVGGWASSEGLSIASVGAAATCAILETL